MFDFRGRTGRLRFSIGIGLRLALLLGFPLAYPFLHRAILQSTGCAYDTCGAVGLVTAMVVKPNVVLLILFSFVGILMRRARDAGLPPWLGLVVLVLILPEMQRLTLAGGPWSLGFASGVVVAGPVAWWILGTVLWLTVVLAALPSRPRRDWRAEPARPIEIAAGIALAHQVLVVLSSFAFTTSLGRTLLTTPWLLTTFFRPVFYTRLAVIAATALILWQRLREDSPPPPSHPASDDAAPPLPIGAIVVAALVVANVEWVLVQTDPFQIIGWVIQFSSTILPTAVIDALLFVAVLMVVRRRTPTAIVLLVVTMLPFGHWAWSVFGDRRARAEELAEIAAVATIAPRPLPDTLVVDSPDGFDWRPLFALQGIENLHLRMRYGRLRPIMLAHRSAPYKPDSVDASVLPPDHLVLLVGARSGFAARQRRWDQNAGPFELRLKTPSGDDLVALDYTKSRMRAPILPVLTTGGWLPTKTEAAAVRAPAEAIVRFLNPVLARMPKGG